MKSKYICLYALALVMGFCGFVYAEKNAFPAIASENVSRTEGTAPGTVHSIKNDTFVFTDARGHDAVITFDPAAPPQGLKTLKSGDKVVLTYKSASEKAIDKIQKQ